jgi:hypothetical protein
MIEKIVKGYNLAIKDFEYAKQGKKPSYVEEHLEELGGSESVYDPLCKLGGCLAWLRHPIVGYRIITRAYNKK